MSSSSSGDEVITSAFLLMAAAIKTKKMRKEKERKKRVVWVKSWLQRREYLQPSLKNFVERTRVVIRISVGVRRNLTTFPYESVGS